MAIGVVISTFVMMHFGLGLHVERVTDRAGLAQVEPSHQACLPS